MGIANKVAPVTLTTHPFIAPGISLGIATDHLVAQLKPDGTP